METQTTGPQPPTERAGAVGHEAKQAAVDVASTAGQEAKQVTREAKDQARQLWSQTRTDLSDQAATQQTRVAGGLRELADQLTQMADASDQDGMARGLVDDVARRAGVAASFLDQRDPGALMDEARSFARRRPGTFLVLAAGVGVLSGRLSRGLIDGARDSDESVGPGSAPSSQVSTGSEHMPGYGTTGPGATGPLGTGMLATTSPAMSTTQSTTSSPAGSTDAVAEDDDFFGGQR